MSKFQNELSEDINNVKGCLSKIEYHAKGIRDYQNNGVKDSNRAGIILEQVAEARESAIKTRQTIEILKTLFAWEAGKLSEGQAMKILNLDRVSARDLRLRYLVFCKEVVD
jgi:hypothetical protein